MTHEDRLLSAARKVWQEDAAPSEASVRRGVDQVVRQLRLRKHSAVAPRVWAASGAAAAFIATLAYAGRGSFLQPMWDALAARGATTEASSGARTVETPIMPRSDRIEGARLAVPANRAALPAPETRDIVLDDERSVLPNTALGNGSGGSGSLAQPPGPHPRGALLGSPSPAAEFAGAEGRRGGAARTADGPRSGGARSGHARTSAASRRTSQAQARAAVTREPSWSDVNEALAVHDRARASELLTRLAEHGPDADTRAKALLGVAQLAAGAGDCEKGRTLALEVAAQPGIERKTIRRALELASRCAP
jgi:hypothetical protein